MQSQNKDPQALSAPFLEVVQTWIDALASYSEEDFAKKPSELEWSIGQVYSHILRSGQGFFMRNAKMCVRDQGEITDESMNEMGQGLFRLGGFPNQRFGVPVKGAEQPPMPDSIGAMREALQTQATMMAELATPVASANPKMKTKHPLFGYLNAEEWYVMNAWHYAHHLHQKARLDAFLAG